MVGLLWNAEPFQYVVLVVSSITRATGEMEAPEMLVEAVPARSPLQSVPYVVLFTG